MAHPNKLPTKKVTYSIREDIFEALRVIREEELHMQSHLLQKALLKYLKENYEELLVQHGIDLWNK